MKAERYLQEIFEREIKRLHSLPKLDAGDVQILEKLVSAYSKFKPLDLGDDGEDLPSVPLEDLLKAAKK